MGPAAKLSRTVGPVLFVYLFARAAKSVSLCVCMRWAQSSTLEMIGRLVGDPLLLKRAVTRCGGGEDGLDVVCLGLGADVPEGAYLGSLGGRGQGDSRVRMTSHGRPGRGGGALMI